MSLFGDEFPDDDSTVDDVAAEIDADTDAQTSPRSNTSYIGHAQIEKDLLAFVHAGRVPHGLVFSGIEGIGKATMAYRFARFLLHRGTDNSAQDSLFGDAPAAPETLDIPQDSEAFRRVAQGAHPDLLIIERSFDDARARQKAAVDVKEVRRIAPFLRMTAADGGWRIVIIDDADTMSRAAQNALLKILEEPPKNTVLILIAHRLGALIPTIRSRLRIMPFQPLAKDQILALLQRYRAFPGDALANRLIARTDGSFGRALHESAPAQVEVMQKLLDTLAAPWEWAEIHRLADSIGGYGQDAAWQSFQDCFLWHYQNQLREKARGMVKTAWPLARQIEICDKLREHFRQIDTGNLDRRQGVLGAFALIDDEQQRAA